MKVCFISFEYPPNIEGGAGTYAQFLVKGLRDIGVDVHVITRGEKNACDQKTYRIPTVDVPYFRRAFFMEPAISLLYRLNRMNKFDLVHFNEPHIMFRKPRLPTVCSIHSLQLNEIRVKLANIKTLRDKKSIRDLVLKSYVGCITDVLKTHATDRIICSAPNLVRLIESCCFIDRQKIHVISNAIDLKAFDDVNRDTNVLNKYGLEEENFILFVGRLKVLKGVQYLIKAFKSIKKEYERLKLVIVGDGDFEPYLRNLAFGIDDIIFTGYVNSLMVKKQLYDNCLAVSVPSLYEGLPTVIMEAMACRKAVIGSNAGGIPFLIKHGKNGFLAKPGDSKSLERFIRILCDDENLRKSMGSFGRKLVEKEFNVDKMVGKTLKVYESLF